MYGLSDQEKGEIDSKMESTPLLHKKMIRFLFACFTIFVLSILVLTVTHNRITTVDMKLLTGSSISLSSAFLSILTLFHPFVQSTPAIPGTLQDDGNSILNKDLDPAIFHHIGTYSPRYTVKKDSPAAPLGCKVEVIDSLERHGARYMTTNALKDAQKTLDKIQKGLKDSKEIADDLKFLKDYKLLNGTNDLVPYGALQAWYSGRSTASVYPFLTRVPPFVRATGDEATLDDRVILTAKYWRWGYEGKDFPHGLLETGDQVRQTSSNWPAPNVIFSELNGVNNTLDVSTCTNANNIPDSEGEKGAEYDFAATTIVPTIGKSLQNRLIESGAPSSFNLTGKDIIILSEICSFETVGRASVKNGQLKVQQSPFCTLFNSTEWPVLGYALDLGKWKGAGYGNPYYKALGQGFLRELVARFTGKPPPLAEPTSLNSTIDGNPKDFPLPNQIKGPVVYFDGSHDNQMGPIAAAAGLFNGPALGTEYNAQEKPHNWIFSHIAPFQGKIVFEKLSCLPFGKEYVRIRANEEILPSSTYCQNRSEDDEINAEVHKTLCPLDTFVSNLDFVEQDTEWNTCYSS